ncbi:MAG: KAP family P-loop NTPase fold protein [Planctomycetota bacterium]|jgi:predicted KAP-like P-loop ATPase
MFTADQPIESRKDDVLGTGPFAEHLAEAMLMYGRSESVVIGLYGAWGCGKTSILNMALEHVEKVTEEGKAVGKPIVVRFNPWYFSDQRQLISQFFDQLSSVLGREDTSANLRKAGEKLKVYGNCFKPVSLMPKVGPVALVLSKVFKSMGDVSKSLGELTASDLESTKTELNNLLGKDHRKIIVVMDDIDRLNNTEIRQVFQLVKSLADFQNTIYVLAFDKQVVIKALAKVQEGSGEDYLEKVVQVPFEVPLVSNEQIQKLLRHHLDELIKDIPENRWDRTYWGNIYLGGLRFFFRSIRDVKRYVNSLSFGFGLVKDEVYPIDFIAITAIQVFLPDVYCGIRDNKDLFTGAPGSIEGRVQEQATARCDEILQRAKDFDTDILKELLSRLFPTLDAFYGNVYHGTGDWRKNRRICDPESFDTFFMLSLPEGEIPLGEMERIISLAGDKEPFEKALLGLTENGRIRRFLDRLEDCTESNVPVECIENVITVLMNIGDSFPEEEEGFYSLGGTVMKVLRIFHQLGERLGSQEERFLVFKGAIEQAELSLYTVVREVHALGWDHGKHTREGPKPEQERAVDADQLKVLEELACDKIRIWASDSRLSRSKRLSFTLFAWKEWGKPGEAKRFVNRMIKRNEGLLDFLGTFVGEVKSHGMGDYVYSKQARINLQNVGEFVKVEAIEPRIRKMRRSSEFAQLDDEKKVAVNTFLDTVDGKLED